MTLLEDMWSFYLELTTPEQRGYLWGYAYFLAIVGLWMS